jgi:hypothetical protein
MNSTLHPLRLSLVFVWLATAVVSVLELDGQSRALLVSAGVSDPVWITVLVLGGAALDTVLGLALLLRPCRTVFALALAGMLLMTAIATVLSPVLWLHPLGPLTKNIPLAAALWLLYKESTQESPQP